MQPGGSQNPPTTCKDWIIVEASASFHWGYRTKGKNNVCQLESYLCLEMNSHFTHESDSNSGCQLATQQGFHLQEKHKDFLVCLIADGWLPHRVHKTEKGGAALGTDSSGCMMLCSWACGLDLEFRHHQFPEFRSWVFFLSLQRGRWLSVKMSV